MRVTGFLTFILYFLVFYISYTQAQIDEVDDLIGERIFCKFCGSAITNMNDAINIESSLAITKRNISLFGHNTLVQRFKNPHGRKFLELTKFFLIIYSGSSFELIGVKKSSVECTHQSFSENSWFEGYSWKVCG